MFFSNEEVSEKQKIYLIFEFRGPHDSYPS